MDDQIEYKGFILNCKPVPLTDQQFSANLVIIRLPRETKSVYSLFPEFSGSRAAAVQFAAEMGREWVDRRG